MRSRSVASGSLMVAAAVSSIEISGGSVMPDAAHSASTMRRMPSSSRVRTPASSDRTLRPSVATAGMMLLFVPACNEPTVTTARSCGCTSRETSVCNRITMAAAVTTGSIVDCGRDPWPPRPWMVTVMLSAPAIAGPAVRLTTPAGM